MLSQIRSATEAISLKIQKVSKWFYVSHPKLEDVDFKVISHQVYNAVKYSNTNSETDDQLSIKGDTFKIKSVYVMPLDGTMAVLTVRSDEIHNLMLLLFHRQDLN